MPFAGVWIGSHNRTWLDGNVKVGGITPTIT
jgi:hypothetical protein